MDKVGAIRATAAMARAMAMAAMITTEVEITVVTTTAEDMVDMVVTIIPDTETMVNTRITPTIHNNINIRIITRKEKKIIIRKVFFLLKRM